MKINASTSAQKWRFFSFCASAIALLVMLIPGSLIVWSSEYGATNVSYVWNFESWFCPLAFALAAVSGFSTAVALKNGESRLADNLIANGMALLFLRLSEASLDIWLCREAGHSVWLPYVPPVLLVISMVAAVISAFAGRQDAPAKKPEKKALSSPGQMWRLAGAVFGTAAAVIMAVPGTRLLKFHGDDIHSYVKLSYLSPDVYSAFLPNLGYALVILAAVYLIVGFVKRKDRVTTILLCDAGALFFMYYIDFHTVLRAMNQGLFLWLPFLPPVLLVLSMLASVIAWFTGRKE